MPGSIQGPECRIVLLGETRSGKSVIGNTILGSDVFESRTDFHSVTKTCQKGEMWLNGTKIVVVDTSGFFHTWFPLESNPVTKSVSFCSPGPHVILWVVGPFCFSHKEKDVAQLIKEMFSLKGKNYMIILFVRCFHLEGKTLERFIAKGGPFLSDQVSQCGNRVLAFNNRAKGEEREAQVAQLMTMIDDLVEKNRDAPCYTEGMIKAVIENYKEKYASSLLLYTLHFTL
ncbi:GTPase IMAP family member 9-like [Pituophis catenifer annectens]|uniref:GTPase IMAP family member 9-like n=1 Tax=Pituophis catenifer annectens TaxID=94852 RepID=UPI0039960D07